MSDQAPEFNPDLYAPGAEALPAWPPLVIAPDPTPAEVEASQTGVDPEIAAIVAGLNIPDLPDLPPAPVVEVEAPVEVVPEAPQREDLPVGIFSVPVERRDVAAPEAPVTAVSPIATPAVTGPLSVGAAPATEARPRVSKRRGYAKPLTAGEISQALPTDGTTPIYDTLAIEFGFPLFKG